MKALIVALPWLVVAVAALVYALVSPLAKIDSATRLWEEFRHYLVPMLLAAILFLFGKGVAEGMEEGLKRRTPPPRK